MESFCDGGNFRSVEMETPEGVKYSAPAHWRDLGEKSGGLYSPRVSWSDVIINGVPLEKTFEFEDDILRIKEEKDNSPSGASVIVVNSRQCQKPKYYEGVEEKRWVRRLEKLYPMNFREAKKKRKSIERFPVKPKSKKQVRDEKIYYSADKFHEITDENLGGESVLDYSIMIHRHGDYTIIEEIDMSSVTPSYPWLPQRYITRKIPVYTKYCPPLHWLEPEIQWEKIWSHVDELKTGKKRDYYYFSAFVSRPFDYNIGKPCIFFDYDYDEFDCKFVYTRDYMDESQYLNMRYD
jgi:hypothetical protein